jgi:hypothetical protein
MLKHYILDKNKNVIKATLSEYVNWCTDDTRRVGFSESKTHQVSTVFLGVNYGDDVTPILFETMVFPIDSFTDVYCERYSTWDEALKGHKRISKLWKTKEIVAQDGPVIKWLSK